MTTKTEPSDDGNGAVPTFFEERLEGHRKGEIVTLAGEETAHVRSLRLRVGAQVHLTDGRGRRWRGRLETLERRRSTIALEARAETVAPYPVTLWAPVGHKDRLLWLIEKAVEIGAERVCFIEYRRSSSVVDAGRSDAFLERARKRAISALKQSAGSRLPELSVGIGFEEALESVDQREQTRWLADAAGRPVGEASTGEAVLLAVGPEGGLTADERGAFLDADFIPVSMGPRVLRFETAALYGLSVAAAAFEVGGVGRGAGDANEGR